MSGFPGWLGVSFIDKSLSSGCLYVPAFYMLSSGLSLNFENGMLGKHLSGTLGKSEDGDELERGKHR